jgi:hypothetical protein
VLKEFWYQLTVMALLKKMSDDVDTDLKTRGGLRENSSTLHLAKKIRKFKCIWCGVSYSSIQAQSKFCCHEHKLKDYRARKSFKNKKRVSELARKGKNFRPHRLHLAQFRIAQLGMMKLKKEDRNLLSSQGLSSQAHVPVVEEQAD